MKWKFMQIEPQPARGVLREEMWKSPDWIAEEKYDGDRRIAQFCGKVVRFTGRRVSVKDGLFVEKSANIPQLSAMGNWNDHAAQGVIVSRAPLVVLDGTVLDGEMIAGGQYHAIEGERAGGLSKYVTSIMGSLPEEAVRKQIERGWLRYVVFDCLFLKGEDIRDLPLIARQKHLSDVLSIWKNPFASQAERWTNATGKRERFKLITQAGGEGVILKHVDHTYGDKTLWVKVKKQATADVVIMGFIPAKEMSVKKGDDKATLTKYAKAGLIGAIQCGQHTLLSDGSPRGAEIEVATVSGMTDELRAEFTRHPKKYIGRVIEIEHNGREPTGRFRHPRFNRFRDDKSAIDCVYREDES